MASVNYMKLKSQTEVARLIRHCDKTTRAQDTHSNPHIDKEMTQHNGQMRSRGGCEDALQYYTNRIAQLDNTTNRNHRKDRVTAFSLEVPAPEGMSITTFSGIVLGCIGTMYGKDNIIQAYAHRDEVHQYIDHGQIRTSREHLHVLVIPEINGQLNGKAFSSRTRMRQLNKSIDQACRNKGYIFLTGTTPRRQTVEELKRASQAEIDRLKAVEGRYERLRSLCDDRTLAEHDNQEYKRQKRQRRSRFDAVRHNSTECDR